MRTSTIAAGTLVIALVLWMASGMVRSNDDDTAKASSQGKDLMKVEVQTIALEPVAREIILQGQLEANRDVMVRANTSGDVEHIAVNKGDSVKAGDLLVRLSLDGRDSDLAEAQAQVQSAASEQQAARQLSSQGLQSQVQLQRAQADLASARANLARVQRDIDNIEIKAPFDGVVNTLPVEIGHQINPRDMVAQIVDDSSFKVTAQAAQQTVASLAIGQHVNVKLITGQTLSGKLSYISTVADSDTRSFDVEATADNPQSNVAAGVSASVIIPVEQMQAAFITPSALSLGDSGEIGVKVVSDSNTVEFQSIKIVSTTLDGAWVTGVDEGTRVITLGQGFVNEGERVEPHTAQASEASGGQ